MEYTRFQLHCEITMAREQLPLITILACLKQSESFHVYKAILDQIW